MYRPVRRSGHFRHNAGEQLSTVAAQKINAPDLFYENAIEIEEINEKLLTLRTIDPPGIVRYAAGYWHRLTASVSLLFIGAGSLPGSLRPSRCLTMVLPHCWGVPSLCDCLTVAHCQWMPSLHSATAASGFQSGCILLSQW